MSSFQEAILQASSFAQETLSAFASGDFVVHLLIGGAIGGSFVLGVVRNGLSKAISGAFGGAFAVLTLWLVAKLITLAFGF